MEFPLTSEEERLCQERGVPLLEYERACRVLTGWAEKRARRQKNPEDGDALILACRLGIWQALLVYEVGYGATFCTFATWRVRGQYVQEMRLLTGFTGRMKVQPRIISLDTPILKGGELIGRLGEVLPHPGVGPERETESELENTRLRQMVEALCRQERASVLALLEGRTLASIDGPEFRERARRHRKSGLQRLREQLERDG